MKNSYYNLKNLKSIYLKPDTNSEIISEILYGEKFKIISKNRDWIKIKTTYDDYLGFIKNNNLTQDFSPTHKVANLKAQIFVKKKKKLIKSKKYLPYASRISILANDKNFSKFQKNGWIKNSDIKKESEIDINPNKILKYFINIRYKWGGKSFAGIDCSGLIQIFFYYNNIYCPRDTKKQLPYFKNLSKRSFKFKKNIIFWKGHVAYCFNKKKLIHAYGPKKKVVIMNIEKTINQIFKDTKLKPIYIES